MKKLLLFGALAFSFGVHSQTVIFQDNFDNGLSNWTLGGAGGNNWVVNNSYTGWPGLIPDTPNQPGGIGGSPQSNYLHIVNGTVCSGLSVCNANFDTGSPSDVTAQNTIPIDCSGATSVSVDFWYLCMGQAGTSYGELLVSVDGGTTWTSVQTYSGVSTWTSTSEDITAIAAGQGAVLVRFRWQNGGAGFDPAFSIDDLEVSAQLGAPSNTITTSNTITPSSWCKGSTTTVMVEFVSTGTYNPSNIYSAEISDASGSFASPTTVGSLSSSASGSLSMSAIIPGTLPDGSGYRIRVNASDPVVTGTDNQSNLVIHALPSVTLSSFSTVCDNDPSFALTGGTPAGGTYSGTGVSGGDFDPSTAGSGTHTITYTYTDGNGCSSSQSQPITVDACASISELEANAFVLYPNPANGEFTIESTYEIGQIEIIDVAGRRVALFEKSSNKYDITGLKPGVYSVRITSGYHQATNRLLIK